MYGQHAAEESLRMLQSVGDVSFVPLPGSERCCGGAGIYNLLEPELSKQVLGEKIESIRTTGADVIATGNAGCQMQIGAGARLAGLNIRVCHPVELLDEWYARIGRYE
jgi:glycolate oxidase iron-sulfur subunit